MKAMRSTSLRALCSKRYGTLVPVLWTISVWVGMNFRSSDGARNLIFSFYHYRPGLQFDFQCSLSWLHPYLSVVQKEKLKHKVYNRAAPGFEPGTSRTRSGNHTTRPRGRDDSEQRCVRIPSF